MLARTAICGTLVLAAATAFAAGPARTPLNYTVTVGAAPAGVETKQIRIDDQFSTPQSHLHLIMSADPMPTGVLGFYLSNRNGVRFAELAFQDQADGAAFVTFRRTTENGTTNESASAGPVNGQTQLTFDRSGHDHIVSLEYTRGPDAGDPNKFWSFGANTAFMTGGGGQTGFNSGMIMFQSGSTITTGNQMARHVMTSFGGLTGRHAANAAYYETGSHRFLGVSYLHDPPLTTPASPN
jgi:hypothetical protein